MESKKHKGKIAEQNARNSGYTFVAIAKRMGMSRNTLYNRFKQADLSNDFLYKLGQAINYDFTTDFPELQKSKLYRSAELLSLPHIKDNQELYEIQVKYYRILEDYNKLLKFLIRIINENELYTLKKEIDHFIEHNLG